MPLWSSLNSTLSLAGLFASSWAARRFHITTGRLPLVHIMITDRCNSRCRGCDIWELRPDSPPELTTEEILGLLPALRALKTRIVSIAGGEPTLRDDLETCIKAFHDAGMGVHMLSNGLALGADRARSLVEAGLSVVRISCDHVNPEGYKAIRGVDGYHKVVAAMRHFRSLPKPIPVGVNVVISRLNQDSIGQFADRAIEWGVQKLQFIPIHTHLQHRTMDRAIFEPLMPALEDLPAIIEALKQATKRLREAGIRTNSTYFIDHFDLAYKPLRPVPCMVGVFSVTLTPFGEVVPCYQIPSGLNIRDMPLDQIIRSKEFRELRRQVARCRMPCWDVGFAEPNLLFHLPYLLRHPVEALRQVRFNAPETQDPDAGRCGCN